VTRLARRCTTTGLARGSLAALVVVLAAPVALAGCRPSGTEEPAAHGPTEARWIEPRSASAAIDKDLIRTVVRTHVGEIRSCYEQGLIADPQLAGRVSVRFTIDARGMVSEASVVSSTLPTAAEPVAACIVGALKAWRFPVPPASTDAVVIYPFVFAPGRLVTSPSGLIEGEQRDGRWFAVDGFSTGAAVVEVLDLQHRPVVGTKVILAVALGATSEEREATTDAAGRAVFEGLPSGATAIAMIKMVEPDVHTESVAVGGGAVGVIVLAGR
jgi:hypothetical protein